ncbi:MAG: flagellum-specific ATP synthase FliI, partial [Desulfonatronovibrio sp.]
MTLDINTCMRLLSDINPVLTYGKVSKVIGLVVEGQGIKAPLGSICRLLPDEKNRKSSINAEVVGFRDGAVLFMPYEDMRGIKPGTLIKNI